MLEYLSTPDDVIAVRISGRLDRRELESLVERFSRSLDEREHTHVYAEVNRLSGMETEGMAGHLRRTAPMLGRLRKFGRIAIVADQSWLRWASQVESALLPYVSYEVYTPEERERAYRWVLGREPLPHRPALSIIETDNPAVTGFEIDGKLTEPEIRAAVDYFNQRAAGSDRLNIFGRVKRLGGFEMRSFLERDFIAMKRGLIDKVDRYAIVGGPFWLRHWVGMLDGVLRIDVRHFDPGAEAEAWTWLGAQPTGQRPLI